jgi:tRNA(Ile)-lysidine synthase
VRGVANTNADGRGSGPHCPPSGGTAESDPAAFDLRGASVGLMADLLPRVRAGGLLPAGQPVLVLLSGGRDSVCLLDVAVRLAGPGQVAALHCNYGLRDDAAGDEAHCAALGEELGVELHVRRPRRPERAGNLQAWARDERYAEATALVARRGGVAAAGHTASDQVETVL